MGKESKSLKNMIDLFLQDSSKTIKRVKQSHQSPTEEEITQISQRVWDLHHFAKELLRTNPTESLYYNAKIVKDLVEQRLNNPEKSLLEAADEMKKENHKNSMNSVITMLAEEDKARIVLFGNLEEISTELAA